jgi:formylglycine-generating enzyme
VNETSEEIPKPFRRLLRSIMEPVSPASGGTVRNSTLCVLLLSFFAVVPTRQLRSQNPVPSSSSAAKKIRPSPKNRAGIEFVRIPGGTFRMGDAFGEGAPDEKPAHTVSLSGFFLGKTEVTVAQYRAFCEATGRTMPRPPMWGWIDNHPMCNIAWKDAQAFCIWAECRLPTEAEWEYAAREGGKRVRFGDGRNIADSRRINFDGRRKMINPIKKISVDGEFRRRTTAVASFPPNAFGLYDMSGNVAEYCSDWWAPVYYGTGPKSDPQGPANGFGRVHRGGAYDCSPSLIRNTARGNAPVISWGDDWGFRAARPAGP